MRSTPELELLLAPLPHRCTECNTSLLTRQGITHPSPPPLPASRCTRWIRSMTFTKLLKYEVVPIICCSKWALDDAAASRVPTSCSFPPPPSLRCSYFKLQLQASHASRILSSHASSVSDFCYTWSNTCIYVCRIYMYYIYICMYICL